MKYPIQIAYPFKKGVCFNPSIKGFSSQNTIKTRWDDGSAKHAIFNFVAEGSQGQGVPIEFVEGVSTPMDIFPINAEIEMQGVIISLNDLPSWSWLPNSLVYADHSGSHDILSLSGTKARPIFFVTYYPEVNLAKIRFMLENSNTQAAGECLAPVKFRINGVEVFSNTALPWQSQMMPCGSRFTKTFWSSPYGKINFKFDLKDLIACGAVPNYDTSIKVNESALVNCYNTWLTSDKNIANRTNNQWGSFCKSMGTAGARADLGPFPSWTTYWLYTCDPRMDEVDFGNAELASMFAMHYRENDPTKASFGRPMRITDRPTCQMKNLTTIIPVADLDMWGLIPDPAHKPNPFFIRYLLNGDYYHLEEMFFWEGFSAAWSNGAGINAPYGRGPTGKEGGIPGSTGANFQIRGQGWVFGGRAQLAWICPDDLSEKQYFTKLTHDAIQVWEGQRLIGDMSDELRVWGRKVDPQDSPLHLWEKGNAGLVGDPVDGNKASLAISPWEVSFLVLNLLTGKRLDFPVGNLLSWLKPAMEAMQKYLAAYRIGTTSNLNNYFSIWQDVINSYVAGYDVNNNWETQRNLDHGYTLLAGQQIIATENPQLWRWYKSEVYDKINWSDNPKWAILP